MSASDSNDEDESESDTGSENGPQFGYYMCMICMGTARNPRVSFCGHVFCNSCICKWMNRKMIKGKPKCPYCQSRIGDRTIITLNQTDSVLYNSDGTLTNVPIAEHRGYCDTIATLIPPPGPSLIVGGSVTRLPALMPRHKPLDPQLLQGLRQEEENQRSFFVGSMWQRFVILVLMISIFFFNPISKRREI